MPPQVTEAAGGVLWRPALGGMGVEIALVHRPKYDDWSLPKGKLESGEHPVIAAVREIQEETGFTSVPGRRLGETRYFKDGHPKRVRYWAMRATSGSFAPTDEVDQVMWLPPKEAQRHLEADRDRDIAVEFVRDADETWPMLLLRHASAGESSMWRGPDRERPLDALGRAQAQMLVPLLAAYDVSRLLSADVLRCLDTVAPYAHERNLAVESEPLVSESGVQQQPRAAVERLLSAINGQQPVAVCSQGHAMPHLIAQVCTTFGVPVPRDTSTRKGGVWVLHFAANGKERLVDFQRFGPQVG